MQGRSILKAFSLMLFLIVTQQLIQFNELFRYNRADILRSPLVQIIQASNDTIPNLHSQYLIIKVVEKESRLAYHKRGIIFKECVKILKKNGIIQSEIQLVRSFLRPTFLATKRRWDLSVIFVINSPNELLLTKTVAQLETRGAIKLSANPSINYLNEKLESLKVFSSAKWKVISELERLFPGVELKQVEQIEINGRYFQNSDLLERQIEHEFSDSDELMNYNDVACRDSLPKQLHESNHLEMRIIFKVGQVRRQEQSEDYDDDDSQSEVSEQSIESQLSQFDQ